ncbi:MAG: aspartate/glutamate racemase family protein [Saprospiraceae bacterium]
MIKHIGIIACSYEGAALCYKTICNEGSIVLGEHNHPEISLHTFPLSEYMAFINRDEWEGVANLMRTSAQKLTSIGAEVLICPDNTIHRAFSNASEGITIPWLHIAAEVAKEAKRNNFKKIGILGTKYLMESSVYPDIFRAQAIDFLVPDKEHRLRINQIIFDELVYGIIKEGSKNYLLAVIEEFKIASCDAVVLGCTEIPLIVFPNESALPTLDSTRILARAALKAAVE